MPIRFACEHCGQKLSVSSRKAGVVARCPKCQQKIQVPGAAAIEREEEAAPVGAAGPVPEGEAAAPADSPPPAGESDPYAQFVVYDDGVEWVFEDEDAPVRAAPVNIDMQRVAVPRGVLYAQGILLAVVALVAFLFGILVGGIRSAPDVALVAQPCTISGQVRYQSAGGASVPDEGTVVIVLPQDQRPTATERVPIEGLRPGDPEPNENNPGLRAIRMLGGSYARTDAGGGFQLRVPSSGAYYVLVVSRNKYRHENEDPSRADLAQLGGYFLPATDLLGTSKYQWSGVTIHRDYTLDVLF